MRKIFGLVAALFMFLTLSFSASYAAEKAPAFEKKDAFIFYEVPDQILMCQNKQEDMVKGAAQFEKMLGKYYKNRFNVIGFERTYIEVGDDDKFPEDEKKKIFVTAQHALPILVRIDLLGNSTATDTYQNGFGAQKTITVPTTTIAYSELFGVREENGFYGYNVVKDYRPGTYSLFGELFTKNTDARTLTKTCVEAFVRDINKYNPPNKYTEPEAYDNYWAAYTGNMPRH